MSIDKKTLTVISSPIRWAGSKKTIIKDLLDVFPSDKENYIEPFLGSGVVLLNVLINSDKFSFKNYYVNDINKNIIGFYKSLQNSECVYELVRKINNLIKKYNSLANINEKSNYYYHQRNKYNYVDLEDIDKFVVFFFLMKAGFNGVYRVNSKGFFNVPFGKKELLNFNSESLFRVRDLVKKVHFYSVDYYSFLEKIEKRKLTSCFVYCDPPYIPDDKSFYQKQMLYSKNTFDHNEFASNCMRISNNNNWTIYISMSDSTIANKIYMSCGYIKHDIKELSRIINPLIDFKSKEVIFTNNK